MFVFVVGHKFGTILRKREIKSSFNTVQALKTIAVTEQK